MSLSTEEGTPQNTAPNTYPTSTATASSRNEGAKSLTAMIVASDEILYSRTTKDVVGLPPHLLEEVLNKLHSENQKLQQKLKIEKYWGHRVDLELVHRRAGLNEHLPRTEERMEVCREEFNHHKELWQYDSTPNKKEEASQQRARGKKDSKTAKSSNSDLRYTTIWDINFNSNKAEFVKGNPWESGQLWHEQISIQLLYYRLTTMFGMMPAIEQSNDARQIWSTVLVHKDRRSKITFNDRKGAASWEFYGTK